MGYTHYWDQSRALTDEEWAQVLDATGKIVKAANKRGIVLGNWLGEHAPVVTGNEVAFNGDAACGHDHESFVIKQKDAEWTFCKTARKPYDLAVTAVLAYLASAHHSVFSVSSDGGAAEWEDGCMLASEALGTHIANPMIVNQLAGENQ